MARFLISAFTATTALLGLLPADSAWAQSCREPDPDRLRTPIGENRIPFHLTVDKVRSAKGNIVITLYGDDPKRWLAEEGSLYIYTVPANAPMTKSCIYLPGANKYAIAVYHDANGDGKIGRNFLGVPTEDGGLSNNPPLVRMLWPKLRPSLMNINRPGMATTIRLIRPPL